MRADRLISILLLLQADRRITARELARRLEVSERTILRDMDVLSGAGIPVVAERGAGGGWSLLDNYRTNLTGLKETEIRALFFAPSPRLLADLGLAQDAAAATVKLLAAAPPASQRAAESVRQRIYVDATGWNGAEEHVPFLQMLQEATWQQCKVRLRYKRGDDREVERLIDPLGLVAKGSVWYLVAAVEGEIRSYRASRVLAAETTGECFVRPTGFDLGSYWEQSAEDFLARLPRYPVIVRMHPDLIWRMQYEGRSSRIEQVDRPNADGWQRVALNFHGTEEACEWLLGFGPGVEVLEPQELRDKLSGLAHRIAALYACNTPNKVPDPE